MQLEENPIVWKPITAWKDCPNYEISNTGWLKNITTGYITAGSVGENGYYRVGPVDSSGKTINVGIHTIVCSVFNGPKPGESYTVDHIDRDPSNNAAWNLRWASKSEQVKNQKKKGPRRYGKMVTQYALDGTPIFTWFRVKAVKIAGYHEGSIATALRENKPAYGFIWKYSLNILSGETWRQLPRHLLKDDIWVSDFGRVYRNHKTFYGSTDGAGRKIVEFFLANGQAERWFVHRLVMLAFYGPNEEMVVNHIDSNPKNNKLSNLEYVTQQRNVQHAVDNGRYQDQSISPTAIPVICMDMIGNEITRYPSGLAAERATGVTSSQISKCCRGKTKDEAGGFRWKYAVEGGGYTHLETEKDSKAGFKEEIDSYQSVSRYNLLNPDAQKIVDAGLPSKPLKIKKESKIKSSEEKKFLKETPVICMDLKGVEIARYENSKAAAIAVNVRPYRIENACVGKTQTCVEFKWRFDLKDISVATEQQ